MQTRSPKYRVPSLLCRDLLEEINPKHPLVILSEKIPWEEFDKAFASKYSIHGRPYSIRLMVGLLILKQMHNLSDDKVIEMWIQNPYFQVFCGEIRFRWDPPCASSDLIHFRKCIGEDGIKQILEICSKLHGVKFKKKR